MTCDDVRPRLTAYLDGDLDPDRGTVVRGHLRTCDACRKVSEQEAVLRDGLRDLPTLDPPPALWANIQAQLAAAEVEDAKRPAWKRVLAKWTPMLPRFAIGGVLAAAAVGILWWRASASEPTPVAEAPKPTRVIDTPSPEISPSMAVRTECNLESPVGTDVTEDLRAGTARVTACYAQTATDLLALASDVRRGWSAEQQATFDTEVAALRKAVDDAEDGRPRQRAWRAMNRYLTTALTRDQVVLAGVTP